MKETVYSGRILDLSVHRVKVEGRDIVRELVEHRGAAALLGFDGDGRVILVRQHRYPRGYILEIPAGLLERGEDPADCARREMLEEAGYRAQELVHLLSFSPSVGYSTEVIHCYTASGLQEADVNPDDDEFITVVKMDLGDLIGMIRRGEIEDSKTICAVMVYAARNGLA